MDDMITRAMKKYSTYLYELRKAEAEKRRLKNLLKDNNTQPWLKLDIKREIEFKNEDCHIAYGRTQAAENILVSILGVPMSEIRRVQNEVKEKEIT